MATIWIGIRSARVSGPRRFPPQLARLTLTSSNFFLRLNRAVAVARILGLQAGLELVDTLTSEPSLRGHHLLPTARGDLLAKPGRFDETRPEFERAGCLAFSAYCGYDVSLKPGGAAEACAPLFFSAERCTSVAPCLQGVSSQSSPNTSPPAIVMAAFKVFGVIFLRLRVRTELSQRTASGLAP